MKDSFVLGAMACVFFLAIPVRISAQQGQPQRPRLILFHSPSCHSCVKFIHEVLPEIEKTFKEKVEIEHRSIDDIENYRLLLSLSRAHKATLSNVLPILYMEGFFLEPNGKSLAEIEAFIQQGLTRNSAQIKKVPTTMVDLVERFKSFTPLVIIGVGLVDGINPCAFTVIVFFISFIALQGYAKRDLIIIGLCFIFAVFLTYLSLGIGLFGFLYSLKGFWLTIKIFNYAVGALSLVLGGFALYDAATFKKTGSSEDLMLQLPAPVKQRIHSVIGLHYRKTNGPDGKPVVERHMVRLVISALVTGFLVSLLEAVCTGQTYLPTIAFVLKTTPLKLQALGYLLLYNVMFIVPLFFVFILALLGATSQDFANFLKRHMLFIKIAMAFLFFGLGGFLIWRG